jgi:transposase
MLKEEDRWEIQVLHRNGNSARHISEITHHSRNTIRSVLAVVASRAASNENASSGQPTALKRAARLSMVEPFKEFLLHRSKEGLSMAELLLEARGRGFSGSRQTFERFLRVSQVKIATNTERAMNWMHLVLQGAKTACHIKKDIGDALAEDDITTLLTCIKTRPLKARNRALTLLAHGNRITPGQIASFLCIGRKTVRRYISDFKKGGIQCVLVRTRSGVRKAANPDYAAAVFKTLHAPPSAFGFNRTTWRMDDLHAVLSMQGVPISKAIIHKIIKKAGYTFRKARRVLTSTDPEYREKLQKIMQILANLKVDEKFFSIDEYGPFSVKMMGGRALTEPGELRTVPERQKSKGSLIATAALELSTNQVTHFYSEKKNTAEMIRLLDLLISQYHGQTRIFFSWDAASWHASKKFFGRVDEVNQAAYRAEHGTPIVELAPLPSCAPFLNVIEAVFSGMARAIIHNSDYASVEAAKAAIDRYFAERNDHFQKHPRRAGKKLWGKERIEPEFNEANNCKDPGW